MLGLIRKYVPATGLNKSEFTGNPMNQVAEDNVRVLVHGCFVCKENASKRKGMFKKSVLVILVLMAIVLIAKAH